MAAKVKKELSCSICGEKILKDPISGWDEGNNAEPVNSGRCCDSCNETKVVPQRFKEVLSLTSMVGHREPNTI